jgi:integrase
MKALVLLLASTGMRIGALPTLKVSDIFQSDKEINKVVVYADYKDKYITFMTPECSKAVTDYLDFRKKSGEKISDASPLIREQFNINDLGKIRNNVHPLCRDNYSNIIRHALIKCGLREVNHSYGGRQRHKITAADGFRKFFTNQLIEADIKTEYRWLLEGHDLKGNDRYYVRITEQKLYEEYQKAIPFLTVDPTQKLQKKVDELSHRNDRLERALDKIDRLEKELGLS